MRISLKVEAGSHERQVFEFEGHNNFVVGRSRRAHFRLPDKDKHISRIQFMIEVNAPLSRLMDMGSMNGTLVNDGRVSTVELKDGDLIKVGISVLRVSLTDIDVSADSTSAAATTPPPEVDGVGVSTETLATRFVPEPGPLQATVEFPLGQAGVTAPCPLCGSPVTASRTTRGPSISDMPIPRASSIATSSLRTCLVTQDGGREVVKLSDFGLARVYQASKMSGLTMKGDLGGTLPYMAPEQITDLREAKPAVDQYSAGATLYKFLTAHYI